MSLADQSSGGAGVFFRFYINWHSASSMMNCANIRLAVLSTHPIHLQSREYKIVLYKRLTIEVPLPRVVIDESTKWLCSLGSLRSWIFGFAEIIFSLFRSSVTARVLDNSLSVCVC